MDIPEYEYSVEDCDVPEVRRSSLSEYRAFRRKCLEYMRGPADTYVTNQVYDLTWHTAVFRTLNETRRIEPNRRVNGAFWELTSAGYASLMTLGIRRLVDRDPRTDSIWNVIAHVERRPELLTREKFICYDGLPYDYEAAHRDHVASLYLSSGGHVGWLPTKGPKAWAMSEMMHKAFDKLSGYPQKRKRSDTIQTACSAIGTTSRLDQHCVAARFIANAVCVTTNAFKRIKSDKLLAVTVRTEAGESGPVIDVRLLLLRM